MTQDFQPGGAFPPASAGGDPGTLDLPWYGIGPVDAFKRFFQKYARFDGRASRGEFWWIQLVAAILAGAFYAVFFAIVLQAEATLEDSGGTSAGEVVVLVAFMLFSLAVIVPSISVTVRRLHDANFSGWYYLLVLLPFLGGLALIVMCALKSNPAGARYDR